MVDAVDRKILGLLAESARMTNAELADKLGMAPSGALKRVRRLEEAGVIRRYETRVSEAALGITTTTFVKVFTNERLGRNEVGKRLAELPEVQEVHYLAGNIDYLLKVRVRDTRGYMDFIRKLGAIEDVRTCESMVVLETVKETAALFLPEPDAAP